MALPSTGVWEVRTTGSDSNGGCFNPARGGTDYSQQDTAQASGTVTVSGTTCTATTGIFTAAMVGNAITDGTSWREITGFTSSTVVTLDSTVAWTGAAVNVGGAMASPGKIGGLVVSGNRTWLKSGNYAISTSTANASGGPYAPGSISNISLVGYGTARGDGGQPTITVNAGVTGITVLTHSANDVRMVFENLIVDGNSQTGVNGFSNSNSRMSGAYCTAKNCPGNGFSNGSYAFSLASNCGTGFGTSISQYACEAVNCTTGFTNGVVYTRCIANACTTGFLGAAGAQCHWTNNSAYGCGTSYSIPSNSGGVAANNISSSSNVKGYSMNGSTILFFNNASYNDAANDSGGVQIALTADPFVAAATANFALNNAAGGGASCRAAGIPGAFSDGTTTGYLDIGAVQHQDSGGGGGGIMLPLNFDGGF